MTSVIEGYGPHHIQSLAVMRQQLVQYRGSAGMVSPRQRVEPGA